ncbi:hypothetical protein DYB35_007210 [Aphanomyces astaci]|uniref:Uncharacterized protein n=1 Tax=Aphanomyces astaci TaxID=112090 RepID=A0A3R6Y5A1_APHAT|nr:hypothetical protein DYB35_007210 [Aphanomyces astaci]
MGLVSEHVKPTVRWREYTQYSASATRLVAVYDVMMEALEDWAKRHGLTTHPLAQPAQMKPADTSFLGTTLGLLAKHAATCGVVARWTSPTWQAPKRYNDRPILPLLDGQQVGALMVINRRFPWQLRHVGDVCNIDGTYVLDDDTLAVRTGWPGTALLTLRRVLQAIPTIPGSRRLRLPVGRSPRPATTMGNYVDTPLYGLVLRAVLLTRPNSPDELSYVIGQRTALATRTDASGIQLTITNWHEHRRGCHRVHHAHCAPAECETAPPSPWQTLHHQSFPTQQGHSTRPITLPAGDGSVLRGGTPMAQGSWAVQHGATIVYGRTYCNPEDLSSTRCESHAIIAGTVLGHDLGTQICDNTSAGAIHRAARRRMLKPWPIRYSHPFRAELRGLMSVMRPCGSFHTVWVRSHQEHEHTTDRQLQAQREALATVDTLATEAHHSAMPSPQTLPIILDTWQLIDHNGRPVMGNTLSWLGNRLATNKWADQKAAYSTDRRTILPTGLETPRTCGWKRGLTRFYWRTIAMTLHINAAKHRLDGRWGPHCRLCYENPRDTVGHRFGISAPTCSESGHLDSRLGHRLHKTCTMSWLPDQHIYPPRMAQEMAITFDLPLAEAWHENERQRPTHSTTYQPMIMLTGSWHMHGLHLSRLTQLPLASTSAGQLISKIRWENMQLRAGQYGYITPRWLGRTALSAQPLLAQREIWLAQQMGTEQPATYNGPWDSCSTRKDDAPALDHRFWWIDAILQGRTDQWWRTLANEITTTAAMAGPYEFWCICYKNSTGHRTLDALGATWNLHIPAGQLRMRHHSTITYSSPPRWAGLTNMNKVDIHLGYIVSPDSDTSTLPTHWAHELQHWGQMTWLMNPPRNTLPSPPPAYTQAIRWDADNDGDPEDPTCHKVHSWLRASFPHIYRAPAAWQRLPTMTNNTLQWAIALSLTPRLGKDFHRRWFTTHWTTLHAYWTHTYYEQYVTTAQDGDTALAQAVNTGVKQRRRAHDDTPAAMDTNLRQAKARRTRDIDTCWVKLMTVVALVALSGVDAKDMAKKSKHCKRDHQVCDDGTKVYRNKELHCKFDPCPGDLDDDDDLDDNENDYEDEDDVDDESVAIVVFATPIPPPPSTVVPSAPEHVWAAMNDAFAHYRDNYDVCTLFKAEPVFVETWNGTYHVVAHADCRLRDLVALAGKFSLLLEPPNSVTDKAPALRLTECGWEDRWGVLINWLTVDAKSGVGVCESPHEKARFDAQPLHYVRPPTNETSLSSMAQGVMHDIVQDKTKVAGVALAAGAISALVLVGVATLLCRKRRQRSTDIDDEEAQLEKVPLSSESPTPQEDVEEAKVK